ncbi:hypothetical protein PIB30_088955 [Stylosanthes scabra]|uniref:Uncharacterized protein n=1 Tax=Stylosanthes scabra TaxID=79078 RepID=A0ABU6UXK8_9FABA|nr:hypothetical protein [Stylosanthes scabra]
MVRTRSASLAKGNAKLCQPATRVSPRLVALRSNTAVQIPTPTLDVLVKEAVTSTLPPKKRQNFRMVGDSSSRRTLELHKEDTNLEQNEAEPVAEVGGRMDLPKNDVYDTLWAMLDVESDNEAAEMPRE